MKLVIIESPYSGDISTNVAYLADCLRDSIARGEAPFASHAIYPMVLQESKKEDRIKGIVLGYQWMSRADLVAVYQDLGISTGMSAAIDRAKDLGIPVEYRSLK